MERTNIIHDLLSNLAELANEHSPFPICYSQATGEFFVGCSPGELLDVLLEHHHLHGVPESEVEPEQKPKRPPFPHELQELILEAAKSGPVKSSQFYALWPDEARGVAGKEVRVVMNWLVERGKLTRSGRGPATAYTLVK